MKLKEAIKEINNLDERSIDEAIRRWDSIANKM